MSPDDLEINDMDKQELRETLEQAEKQLEEKLGKRGASDSPT